VNYSEQQSVERKSWAGIFAGRLSAWAGVWLVASVGPCANRAPQQEPSAAVGSASAASSLAPTVPAPSPPAAAAAAPEVARPATPTTRRYMLTHYADTVNLRRALVAGKLGEVHAAAAAVAKDEWTPRLRGDYKPYLDAVRVAARAAQTASSAAASAAALGKLGEACAACHLKFGGPGSPVAPEQLSDGVDPSMVAHAVATDRLWEGLIFPSDTSWASGMEVLLDAPKLDSDVADVAAAAHHLRDLARKGKSTEVGQRGQIFASVLTTCAGCHERLGVGLRPTPSP